MVAFIDFVLVKVVIHVVVVLLVVDDLTAEEQKVEAAEGHKEAGRAAGAARDGGGRLEGSELRGHVWRNRAWQVPSDRCLAAHVHHNQLPPRCLGLFQSHITTTTTPAAHAAVFTAIAAVNACCTIHQ